MELKANGIGGEGAAGQPGPFDRALSFFDPLLTCPALIIEGDNAFSGPRQVGDDKSDARVQLAWMPFDLGHDMARPVPALCLIAEAGVVTPYLVRWSSDRSLQQISDLILQDLVGRQPDRVAGTLGFKKLVDLRIGKSCITSEIQMLHNASIASDHWFQHSAPAVGTMHIARPQRTPLDIAKLVEYEQRMITGAGKVAVISTAFLFAVGGAF